MAYTPTQWVNGQPPALNAENLNKIEAGIQNIDDEVANVRESIRELETKKFELLELKTTVNVFDKSKALDGKTVYANGSIVDNVDYVASDYIPVKANDTLRFFYYVNGNPYTTSARIVAFYDTDKNVIEAKGSWNSVTAFTVESNGYVRLTLNQSAKDTAVVTINQQTPPSAYVEYEEKYIATVDFIKEALLEQDLLIKKGVQGEVTKEATDFWVKTKSANLFDKATAIDGKYLNYNGTEQSGGIMFYSFVEIEQTGMYTLPTVGSWYGTTNCLKIPVFNGNKEYVKTIDGVAGQYTNINMIPCTINITDDDIADGVKYIGFSQRIDQKSVVMLVVGNTLPTNYVPYSITWTIPELHIDTINPLIGKRVVFDGDSICVGLNSATQTNDGGWARRIGENNNMEWHNVAVSGATITQHLYFDNNTATPRHWLSAYIDTIHTNYSDLDYLIFEGGTNDADNLYGDSDKIGTLSEIDFNVNVFDADTFYGALDTLFAKAVTYYPKAKIGFIIAPKMGLALNADGIKDVYTENRRLFLDKCKAVCKKWGLPCLDLWNEGQLNPNMVTMYDKTLNEVGNLNAGKFYFDGQHLTPKGYDVITDKIEAWLKTL